MSASPRLTLYAPERVDHEAASQISLNDARKIIDDATAAVWCVRLPSPTVYLAPRVAIGQAGSFSFFCASDIHCFTGAGAQTRSGWTAGGGAEYRLDAHWSAKLEYQFVDLGTQLLTVTAIGLNAPGTALSSLTAAFRDQMNVVRGGLNYHF